MIDVRVERDVDRAEIAQAFVQIHADNQDDDADPSWDPRGDERTMGT